MAEFLISLPIPVSILITIIFSSLLSVVLLKLIRRKVAWDKHKENHEVAGFLFNALGLIYAVIVAFVMFISWNEYSEAENFCAREADNLKILYRNSSAFDQMHQEQIRFALNTYLQTVISEEWPILDKGMVSEKARNDFLGLWGIYLRMNDLNDKNTEAVYRESLVNLREAANARMMRVAQSRKRIPPIVWTVIIVGALTSIGFSLFFGTREFRVQAVLTSLFAMTNALIIVLIYMLDHNFSGTTGIKPEAFQILLESLPYGP